MTQAVWVKYLQFHNCRLFKIPNRSSTIRTNIHTFKQQKMLRLRLNDNKNEHDYENIFTFFQILS